MEIIAAPGLRLGLDVPLTYIELFPYVPAVELGAQVLTQYKRIYDAIRARAQAGDFRRMSYSPGGAIVLEGAAVSPKSILFNESHSDYGVALRYRRDYREQRNDWVWELHLDFDKQVTTELFERAILRDPLRIARDVANGLEPVIVKLVDSSAEHPPQQQSSNGTKVTYRFVAQLHPV